MELSKIRDKEGLSSFIDEMKFEKEILDTDLKQFIKFLQLTFVIPKKEIPEKYKDRTIAAIEQKFDIEKTLCSERITGFLDAGWVEVANLSLSGLSNRVSILSSLSSILGEEGQKILDKANQYCMDEKKRISITKNNT